MVQIEYEIGPADAPAFVAAMDEVGHLRRRNGALRWRLFQDLADGDRWIETFVLGDWVEHQRLRRRMTRGRSRRGGPGGRVPPRRRAAAPALHDRPPARQPLPVDRNRAGGSRRRPRSNFPPSPVSRGLVRRELPSLQACASSVLPSQCRVGVSGAGTRQRPAQTKRSKSFLVAGHFGHLGGADRLGEVELLRRRGAGVAVEQAGDPGAAGRPKAWRGRGLRFRRRGRRQRRGPGRRARPPFRARHRLEQVRRHRRAVVAQVLAAGPRAGCGG